MKHDIREQTLDRRGIWRLVTISLKATILSSQNHDSRQIIDELPLPPGYFVFPTPLYRTLNRDLSQPPYLASLTIRRGLLDNSTIVWHSIDKMRLMISYIKSRYCNTATCKQAQV